jgi:uncharacterized RDD family membrane protein YckC
VTPAIPPVGAGGTAALLVTPRGELVLANVGTRIGGFVIDLMIAGAVGFVVAMVVVGAYLVSNGLSIEDELSEAQSTEIGLIIWAVFLPPWFIATWIANAIGWSLGKRILDLRIVTAEGRRPGLGWGLGRTVAAWLSWLPLGLGFIWATWDERRQTWHDKIAGTHVVRAESIAAVEAREREVASLH